MTVEQLRKRERNRRWGAMYRTVLSTVIAAAVIGSFNLLLSLRVTATKTDDRLDNIETQMYGMYASKDAKRDVADIVRRIEHGDALDVEHAKSIGENRSVIRSNRDRIDRLEKRVDHLERGKP